MPCYVDEFPGEAEARAERQRVQECLAELDGRQFSDQDDHDDGYPFDDEDGDCEACGGEGWILTCIDDLCHGVGYCIHGDGMQMCACNTSGEPPSNAPADWLPPGIDEDDVLDCASPFHPGCRKCET